MTKHPSGFILSRFRYKEVFNLSSSVTIGIRIVAVGYKFHYYMYIPGCTFRLHHSHDEITTAINMDNPYNNVTLSPSELIE